jgi:predicted ATPase
VTVILVTGMSGAGKSRALAALARRGHDVVDTAYTGTVEPLLRAGATAQVDTAHVQPDEVADELERIAGVAPT